MDRKLEVIDALTKGQGVVIISLASSGNAQGGVPKLAKGGRL